MQPTKSTSSFTRLAKATARKTGQPIAFMMAVSVIVIWLITGPIFKFDDTWQLVINTGTTIVTFLMVFLIQNTQNRDSLALQVKFNEKELDKIRVNYENLAKQAREDLDENTDDTGAPQIIQS